MPPPSGTGLAFLTQVPGNELRVTGLSWEPSSQSATHSLHGVSHSRESLRRALLPDSMLHSSLPVQCLVRGWPDTSHSKGSVAAQKLQLKLHFTSKSNV